MKVAVTYDNGQVGRHFGHAENFKIYDIREDGIITSEIVPFTGHGHRDAVALMEEKDVLVVISGNMGEEAAQALDEVGIKVYTGAEGDTDQAMDAFLNGELDTQGANCAKDAGDATDDAGCGCGGSCGSGCGGGCGGGCGCGAPAPSFDGPNVGKVCVAHYRGTFDDGSVFDSSYDRDEPIEFVCGGGMMILGFDKAVATMEVGQKVNVHLMPEEAYGPRDPRQVMTIDVSQMPGSEDLEVGQMVALYNGYQEIPALVTEKEGSNITFDLNHQMAGKELNFEIELVEVR